jgi:hypothetical protein
MRAFGIENSKPWWRPKFMNKVILFYKILENWTLLENLGCIQQSNSLWSLKCELAGHHTFAPFHHGWNLSHSHPIVAKAIH